MKALLLQGAQTGSPWGPKFQQSWHLCNCSKGPLRSHRSCLAWRRRRCGVGSGKNRSPRTTAMTTYAAPQQKTCRAREGMLRQQ